MSHNWALATHPYGPGMEHVSHSHPPDPDGLGIWGTLAIVGSSLIANWVAGGSDDIPNDVYFSHAKLGVIYCPGPWEPEPLRDAIEALPLAGSLRAELAEYFRSGVSERDADKWSRYGLPRGAAQTAGALIAEAHGGSDCKGGPESALADSLIVRVFEAEAERRASTIAAQVAARVEEAATVAGSTAERLLNIGPEIIPGVSTPLLVGAAVLGYFAFKN